MVRDFLTASGFRSITDDRSNLKAMYKDFAVGIEVQSRSMSSKTYGDIVMDKEKWERINRRIASGEFAQYLIISVYRDCIAVVNVLADKASEIRQMCNATTTIRGGSREKVAKTLVRYAITRRFNKKTFKMIKKTR